MHKFPRMNSWVSSLVFTLFLVMPTNPARAETLQVSVPQSVSKNLPQVTERIIRALQSTGYNIELLHIPNKRSIDMLNRGKVAIEILRNPKVADKFPNLLIIQPPVMSLVFNMVTSAKTPKVCDVSEEDFGKLSIAGILGVGIYKEYYFPKFYSSTELSDAASLLKFIALQRADVTFLPDQPLAFLPAEMKENLFICSSHQTTFSFNTHIHKDYLWAKKKIEAAYRKEFGTAQD